MSVAKELQAPVLLLAMPHIMDPFFHRSVVLLAAHENAGSYGFVVNRPAGVFVNEILQNMDIDWHGDPRAPAFVGGPVQPQLGTVLYASRASLTLESSTLIAPGISITQHLDSLETLAQEPPRGMRLLLGHAGWSPGQLLDEFLRNDWLMAPLGADLLFSDDPDQAWEQALHSMGVDPASLPSWTPDQDLETN